jgi:hypothetical protein
MQPIEVGYRCLQATTGLGGYAYQLVVSDQCSAANYPYPTRSMHSDSMCMSGNSVARCNLGWPP